MLACLLACFHACMLARIAADAGRTLSSFHHCSTSDRTDNPALALYQIPDILHDEILRQWLKVLLPSTPQCEPASNNIETICRTWRDLQAGVRAPRCTPICSVA